MVLRAGVTNGSYELRLELDNYASMSSWPRLELRITLRVYPKQTTRVSKHHLRMTHRDMINQYCIYRWYFRTLDNWQDLEQCREQGLRRLVGFSAGCDCVEVSWGPRARPE